MKEVQEYLCNMKITTFTIIKIAFKCDSIRVVYVFLINILLIGTQLAQVFVNATFLNDCVNIVSGNKNGYSIITSMVVVLLFMSLNECLKILTGLTQNKLTINMNIFLSSCILNKMKKIEYAYMENTESKNLIERISYNAEKRIVNGLMEIISLCLIMGKGLEICIVLARINPECTMILLGCSCITIFAAVKSGKENYNVEREITVDKRKVNYLSQLLIEKDYINERTLFRYEEEINSWWQQGFNKYILKQVKVLKKWYVYMKAQGIILMGVSTIILISLLWPLNKDILTVGLFISIVNEVVEFSQMVTWDLTSVSEEITKCKEFLKDIRSFFSLKDEKKENITKHIGFEMLSFQDVWFKYPGTEQYILKGLNMTIEKGTNYALVGINGAGKSTIIKLMLGLYDNYEGNIFLNGEELRKFTREELCELYATVFQDFNHYQLSLKDNLTMGRRENLDNQDFEILDKIELNELIEKKIKNNFEIELGKLGRKSIDLSGGEWQKIAIARALISNKPICVFDEPTSSLDPISESELYEEYKKLCRNCTSVLISHRLGACKLVDKIYVLKDGTIIEEGTHDKLLQIDGIYAEMFKKQREWYCGETN